MADIAATIPVILFQEDDKVVAYSPALDISTCGSDEKQARRMFSEAVVIFLNELKDMGTLDEVLEENGWRRDAGKRAWLPPVYKSASEEIIIPAGV